MSQIVLTPAEAERLRSFLYHTVPDSLMQQMSALRAQCLSLAVEVLRGQETSRVQSLALTHLEEALMRAIQGLALQGTPHLPPGFVIEETTP